MKILKQYSFSLLLSVTLLAPAFKSMAGQDPDNEKKKTYTKSYPVSASDKIKLDNQFGEMKINTWDKNEVKVDVAISARSNDDSRAQEILDNISIEDGKTSSGVYFKTKMGEGKKRNYNNSRHGNEGFNIDYTVYVPAHNPLDISNQFGPITMDNYNGSQLEVSSKFGSFTAGRLTNVKSIEVQFGQANIESMNDGDLDIQFSRGLVSNISGKVDAKFQHCSGIKLVIDNNLKDLNIRNSFTQLFLDMNKGLSANFDIYTNFCEVKNKSSFDIKMEDEDNDRHGPKFDHRYYGKTGSANAPVKIRSEFGEVTLGHNINFDLKADESKKGKGSVRI